MLGVIPWIQKNIVMFLLAAAMVSLLGIGIYLAGFVNGKQSVISKAQAKTIEKIVTQRELEYVIMTKPKVEVQNELERKWCRDCQ